MSDNPDNNPRNPGGIRSDPGGADTRQAFSVDDALAELQRRRRQNAPATTTARTNARGGPIGREAEDPPQDPRRGVWPDRSPSAAGA